MLWKDKQQTRRYPRWEKEDSFKVLVSTVVFGDTGVQIVENLKGMVKVKDCRPWTNRSPRPMTERDQDQVRPKKRRWRP